MQFSEHKDKFILSALIEGISQHIVISDEEADNLLRLIKESQVRYSSLHPRQRINISNSGITLGSCGKARIRIQLMPGNMIRISYPPLEDTVTPYELENLESMIRNVLHPEKVKVSTEKFSFKKAMVRFYFMTGIISFLISAICFLLTVVFWAFVIKGVSFLLFAGSSSMLYFVVFIFFQRKNLLRMHDNAGRNFENIILPVLHVLPLQDRKIVEFLLIIAMVGVMMAISLAKCIPFIMGFWSGRYVNM